MQTSRKYQAILAAPFGVLGISCEESTLTGINFLALNTPLLAPQSQFASEVIKQLEAYFENPDLKFTLPCRVGGTLHQRKVWQEMCAIPRGKTRQYGELAQQLSSSARAVGQACGANPIPIVIPCHRIVSKDGMGGFAHQRDGYELGIKRWLLAHEQH